LPVHDTSDLEAPTAQFTTRLPKCLQIRLVVFPLRIILPVTKFSRDRHPPRLPMHRILLAEDDDSMRGFLERALARAGYEVTSFANGEDAYERLKQEPFTLLLTDIVMPRMDGIELARRASEFDPGLKIVFITGFAAVTLNNNADAPKDARVLSKPFHLKDLVREVDRLLAA
jgi:two-component system, cell cycle response regulator CpdR